MDWVNLDDLNIDRIWSDALRILGEVGLQIDDKVLQALAGRLPLREGRVLFPRDLVEAYAAEIRQRFGTAEPSPPAGRTTIFNSSLNLYWLDPVDGRIKPHDVQSVARNTRLLGQMTDEGLMTGAAAGVPQDVPAEMQFLMTHYIDCLYTRHPDSWSLMHSERVMRYIFEIADVMGLRRSIGTEMISPLRLMGQSVDLAIEFCKTGVSVGIDPMPILGVTAPADWHMAWAQSVAENLGCYIVYRECGIEQVGAPSFRLFLANPATCTTYFSSPQHIIALLTRRQVRAFFGLSTPWAELMLVTSKVPDQQAAMEKMAGCLLGKLYGFASLEGAGGLWMDEIFSPQQLLIDVEIRRFVQGIAADLCPGTQDIVAVMREGARRHSFLATDLTLDRFREFMWRSSLFDLRARASWSGDQQSLLNKAAQIAAQKAAAYTYELTGDRRQALDAIMARAKQEFDCAIG